MPRILEWRRPGGVAGPIVLALVVLAAVASAPSPVGAGFPDDPVVCPVRRDVVRSPGPIDASDMSGPARRPSPESVQTWSDFDRDLRFIRWTGISADPLSEELPFIVEAGTVGLTIRADEPGRTRLVSLELLGPGGELLSCEDCPEVPAVGEIKDGSGTVQMPSTDRSGWELEPGEYAVRIRTRPLEEGVPIADEPFTVTAAFRTEVDVAFERVIDLRFIYLPDSGVDAAYMTSNPLFDRMIEGIDKGLWPAGLGVGDVTHVDFDRPEFSQISSWEEAGRMFTTSTDVGEPRTLNVYCVDKFDDQLNPAIGLSGGIPGPVQHGTRDSGIAIRISPFPICMTIEPISDSCLNAYVSLFLHEIGHYLGFYHTTEADLEDADPFSDTPRCDERNLRDCPDLDYVMFPMIHRSNSRWSPGQARVARTHPILRTVPRVRGTLPGPTTVSPPAIVEAGPNPFQDRVRISWAPSGQRTGARVGIWDVAGRRVRERAATGNRWDWDGRDESGAVVPAGIYFVRVRTADGTETLRVVKTR